MRSATTFVYNDRLWEEARRLVRTGKHVVAAVAFLGQRGAALLPFRKGQHLVLDLSLPRVRAGLSDPREVEKLQRQGVEIFSHPNLHAKVIASTTELLVGSANISHPAASRLDEAAALSTDPAAVRRGRDFIASVSTEPVRPEYLALCKREYRPPRVPKAAGAPSPKGRQRQRPAHVWIMNLRRADLPEHEQERAAELDAQVKRLIKAGRNSDTDYVWWPSRPAFADLLRPGDWIVQAIRHEDGRVRVSPPGQFLKLNSYARGKGKRRYLFHLEVPRRIVTVPWHSFRRAVGRESGLALTTKPRTRPIREHAAADAILRLWTSTGYPSGALRTPGPRSS